MGDVNRDLLDAIRAELDHNVSERERLEREAEALLVAADILLRGSRQPDHELPSRNEGPNGRNSSPSDRRKPCPTES